MTAVAALREPPSSAIELEVAMMTKHFGSNQALTDVSMRVKPGTVHALLGENGAGKSTLVKCIMGFYRADKGDVAVDRRGCDIANPRAAHALGLGMVYQHFTLVPNMTVAENLVLARAHLPAVIDWKSERERLAQFLSRMPFKVPLDARVVSIAAGEKQKVEILKQIYLQRRFLILDEPTSVLTPQEADEILGLLRTTAKAGEITILMITHKFREVLAFTDEVTVLRRGRLAGHGIPQELGADEMARMMVGSQEIPPPAKRSDTSGSPRLVISALHADDDIGEPIVKGLDLSVRAGEIVGVAGVSGNGQRQLVEVLAGQRDATSGEVRINGEPYHARRGEMRRHKVACLPEEPLRSASVAKMSVEDNMALRVFDIPPYAAGGWRLRHGPVRQKAIELINRYRVKTAGPDAAIGTLSGGNVQRAVLARELSSDVEVLVVANPCFGLDFAAVAEIRRQIMAARNRGAAVLLVSEDLDEIFELADRILVMFNGTFAYETPTEAADRMIVGRHMAGH
jgi:general nucleoside transport system ATP-binding protein